MPDTGPEMIPAADIDRWHQVLDEIECFDFYHLPAYHVLL